MDEVAWHRAPSSTLQTLSPALSSWIPVMIARFMLCVSLLGLGVLHMATDRATEVEPTVVCRHMILRPCVSS